MLCLLDMSRGQVETIKMGPIDPKDAFNGNNLSEIIRLSFSDDGFTMSGRKVARDNVEFNPGLTSESGYKSLYLSQVSPDTCLLKCPTDIT